MKCRSAHAHGELRYDASKVCVLDYYSGGRKTQELTDDFWTKVEDLYVRLDADLSEFIEKLSMDD